MALAVAAATANPKKLREIEEIFASAVGDGVELLPRPAELPDVVEDGDTLAANAELKARAVADHVDGAAIADDTGLEVDALDGAPGVRSARFAGEDAVDADNVTLLLERLEEVDSTHRTARFRTVICLARPGREPLFAEGVCEGRIARSPSGDGGFGYDPLFIPAGGDATLAELPPAEKHRLSHRGAALGAIAPFVRAYLRTRGMLAADGRGALPST